MSFKNKNKDLYFPPLYKIASAVFAGNADVPFLKSLLQAKQKDVEIRNQKRIE